MGSLHKNIQLILEFLKVPFFVLHFSYYTLYIDDTAVYVDDTILCTKCEEASDLWQQLELASELESDLQDTLDWGRKWLVDFNAGKTQHILFDWSNNTCTIDMKMDGHPLEEKTFLKMLGLSFSSKLVRALTLSLLLKQH